MKKTNPSIVVDSPIKTSKEDVVGRTEVAHDFARSIRKIDASEGVVVGVLGAWGSGKTSFINLMREEFEVEPKLTIVDFNPWMFSGSQQLVTVFFDELIASLKLDRDKFEKVINALGQYGDKIGTALGFIPKIGRPLRASIKWAGKLSRAAIEKEHSAAELKKKVSSALEELDQPIIVVIDDIDRLTTEEIRDMFKLVRLTANFPNLIYVLAFDRDRIEKALDETNIPGRAYLEKIIQINYDLPEIPQEVLRAQILKEFDSLLGDIKDHKFDESRWPDVYVEIIEPSIGSLRDVARLAASARPTLEALGREVDIVDLLGIESVRIFEPALFKNIHENRELLTNISDHYGRDDDSKEKDKIAEMVKAADGNEELVGNLVRRLFPAAERYTGNTHYGNDYFTQWRRSHRLAYIDFLNLYLERAAPSGLLAFRRSEKAYELMQDAKKFGKYLDSIQPDDLEKTIQGLEAYEGEYAAETIVPGAIVLLNHIHTIPENEHAGMFEFNRPDITVGRVVLRMLRSIQEVDEREETAKQILTGIKTYSSELDFISSLGYKEGVGHKLVSEDLAKRMEADFIDKVALKRPVFPAHEWDMLRVYMANMDAQGGKYTPLKLTNVDEIRSLFKSARSVVRSQSFGSRNVKKEEHLVWDILIKIVGSEDTLQKALIILKKKDGDTPLVQLVEKYLSGWRPSRH